MKKLAAVTIVLAFCAVAVAGGTGGIAGQIVCARTGEPVQDAMVLAQGRNGDVGRAQTNARGLYLIEDLDPGVYKVTAKARGFEPAVYPNPVPVREDEITRGIDFRLRPAQQVEPGVITGRVVDRRTGEPIRGAAVLAKSEGGRRQARTDEHGRYVLRGLRPGVYRVACRSPRYVGQVYPKPVGVRPGQVVENINFALVPKPRPGAIAGRVVDARTHKPIAGAVVIARGEHGAARAATDRNGFYRIGPLAPGRYQVTAMKRGYQPETFPRPVPVHPGEVTRHIDFALRRVHIDEE